jgi:hypothetical protein
LAVSPDDIEAYCHRLAAIMDGTPADRIVNFDEIGRQELADREAKTCYVPSEHTGDEVPFPVPQSGKRIILVACVGVDGTLLKLLILISRRTIDADIALTGVTDEKAAIYLQPKGFVDRSILWAWFEDVFIPEICQRCARY